MELPPLKVSAESRHILDSAICELLSKSGEDWYGHILYESKFRLIPERNREDGKPTLTAGVDDQGNFIINPVFFDPLDPETRMGILIHELLHIVWRHPAEMMRLSKAERGKYNIAADLCVNSWISTKRQIGVPHIPSYDFSISDREAMQKGELPSKDAMEEVSKGLYFYHPHNFGFPTGRTAMEYFDMLPDNDSPLMKAVGASMIVSDNNWDMSPEIGEELAEEIESRIHSILTNDKCRGNIPYCLKETLKIIEDRYSKIHWATVLRPYLKRILSGIRKNTYRRPDRRFGFFPGKHREKKSEIVIAVDTSGSTYQDRPAFALEMVAILKETNCTATVIECDAKVGACFKFDGKLPTTMTGGGGTAFLPVFQYIREHKTPCNVLIFLTDGYGENPSRPTYVTYPTIWVSTGSKPADFGKTIFMKN